MVHDRARFRSQILSPVAVYHCSHAFLCVELVRAVPEPTKQACLVIIGSATPF